MNHVIPTHWESHPEPLNDEPKVSVRPFVEEPPTLELKSLPYILKYAYLGANEALLVIITANLSENQQEALLSALKMIRRQLGG